MMYPRTPRSHEPYSLFLLLLLLTGCMAGNYRPVVDPHMSDMSNYESDLLACQGIAKEQGGIAEDAGKGGILGATAGTVAGAVVGAFLGDAAAGAAFGAAYGAATGVTEGAISGAAGQETIIKNCMLGRGYQVLK